MMRSVGAHWFVVFCLVGCGGNGHTPPTQPEPPPVDGGEPNKPGDNDTDTGEPVGPVALAAPPPGNGGAGASGGMGGAGPLGGMSGRSPIGR
ncbi:MAG TPA: hypothetical protein VGK73_04430 [Polyangiaceae bacterium]